MKMFLPFLLAVLLCVLKTKAQSHGDFIYCKDSVVEVNGNRLMLSACIDTILATDPITGNILMSWDYTGYRSEKYPDKIILTPVPVMLNNEPVYSMVSNADIKHCGETTKKNRYLAAYIQRKMKHHYKKLYAAGYNADIRNIVVSKEGRIVYYEYGGLQKVTHANATTLSDHYLERVNKKAIESLNAVTMKPATIKDTPVAYRLKHYELL